MAIRTWSGALGNGLWTAGGNWVGGIAPVNATDGVIFDSTGAGGTIDVGGTNKTVASLTITNSSNITLTNATGFTVSGATNYSGGDFTISPGSGGVAFGGLVTVTGATGTFSVTSAGSQIAFNGASTAGISFQSTGANMTITPFSNISFATGTPVTVPAGATGGTLTFNSSGTINTIGTFTYASTAAIVNFGSPTTLTINSSVVSGTSSNITINAATLALQSNTHGFGNATITSNITTNGSCSLTNNITTSGSWTTTTGSTVLNGYTINASSFTANGTIAFGTSGTSAFNITGTSGTVFATTGSSFLTSGTNNFFNLTGAGATARSISVNGATLTNNVNLKITGGSYALTIGNTNSSFGDITFTGGFTGSIVGDASTFNIGGTLTLTPGMTIGSGAGQITFNTLPSTTRTHELSGVTFNRPVRINGGDSTATAIFSTAVSAPNINALFTINSGKLDITNYTLTAQSLALTGAAAKIVAFGTSGKFYITAPGAGQAIFTNAGSSVSSYTGTPNVTVNTTDTGTKSIDSTAVSEASAYSFYFTGGTYTLSITTASMFKDFNTTGANVTIAGGTNAFTFFGDVVFAAGTVVSTSTGAMTFGSQTTVSRTFSSAVTVDRPITIHTAGTSTLTLNSSVTCSKAFTLTAGIFDVSTYTFTALSLTASAGLTRKLTFGAGGKIVLTGSGSVVTMAALDGVIGTSRIEINNPTATATTLGVGTPTEAFALNFYILSGSYALTMTGARVKTLDFTGFTGSLLATSAPSVYGDLVIPNTVGNFDGTGVVTFFGSSGTSYVDVGKSMNRPFTFSGPKTWQLLKNLNINGTNGALILAEGTIDADAKNITCLTFTSTGNSTRALLLDGGILTATSGGASNASAVAFSVSGKNFSCKLSGFDTPPNGTICLSAENTAIGVGNRTFEGGGGSFSGTISNDILTLTTVTTPTTSFLSVGQYVYACPATPVTTPGVTGGPYDTGKFLGYVTEIISGAVTGTSLSACAGAIGNTVRLSISQSSPLSTAISMRNATLYPEMLLQSHSVLTFTGNNTFKSIRSSVSYPTAMLFTAGTVTGMFDLQYGNIGSGTSFTATGSAVSGGTALTLSSVTGEVWPGATVYGTGLAVGTRIVGQTGTTTLRGAGTYTITPATTGAVSGTVYAQRDCTIDSSVTNGGYHFLSDPSGVKTWIDFIALKNSYASGGATWFAGASCNDSGGNVNWFLTRPTANFHFFT